MTFKKRKEKKCSALTNKPDFNPRDPQRGRKEPSPPNCPLTTEQAGAITSLKYSAQDGYKFLLPRSMYPKTPISKFPDRNVIVMLGELIQALEYEGLLPPLRAPSYLLRCIYIPPWL